MFKVNIQSLQKENLSWSACFDTKEEAQSWLDKQLKKPNRLQEREVTEIDENGLEVKVVLPAEATYEIVDLSKNTKWLNEKVIQARKEEYPSIEEIVHVLVDNGISSKEWKDLQDKRKAVKEKHKKP